jgi:hypothetical protein
MQAQTGIAKPKAAAAPRANAGAKPQGQARPGRSTASRAAGPRAKAHEQSRDSNHPAPLRHYFALLLDGPAPVKRREFELAREDADPVPAGFTPLREIPALTVCLGLLDIAASQPELTLERIELTAPGKAAAKLAVQVLADVPAEFAHWPAPKRQGMLKAFVRALEQLATAPLRHRYWMAQQFAVQGYATVRGLEQVLARTCEKTANWPGAVAKTPDLWLWREAAVQWAGKAVQEVKRAQKHNHFFDELHGAHVSQWLGFAHPELVEFTLKAFAPLVNKRVKQYADGPVVSLGGELLPAPPPPAELDLARRIIESYSSGEGRSLTGLEKAYPSHRHVAAALVEARQLIEGPDGYVFSRKQLRGYFNTLSGANRPGGAPSVRELKDVLGLERRPAEALRAYLLAAGGHAIPPEPKPRSRR